MHPKKVIIKDEKASKGCEIVRAPAQTTLELQTLPTTAIILLLTPVMAASREHRHTDPFEPLGRVISKRHARVRHVPYIAKVGFTSTHRAFMQQAGAIIVASIDTPPSIAQLINDGDSEMADSVFEFVEATPRVPIAFVQFGGPVIKTNDESAEVYLRASHVSTETFALASYTTLDKPWSKTALLGEAATSFRLSLLLFPVCRCTIHTPVRTFMRSRARTESHGSVQNLTYCMISTAARQASRAMLFR
ncbi:hypothetical protein AMS68_007348 [Peltaster fructicola]|uniref:Uncharacterized protein n=1 Tax=Peltaster fructicola TaxID=286661 RepID=A0A6H0Y4I5_9PEZI|nr:hypothetical protein AMS68_007348 [Peltaster fructicola]